jgi:hypothetical protein
VKRSVYGVEGPRSARPQARTRQGVPTTFDGTVGTPLHVHLCPIGKGVRFGFAQGKLSTPLRMTDLWFVSRLQSKFLLGTYPRMDKGANFAGAYAACPALATAGHRPAFASKV